MNREQFKTELEEILIQLFDEHITGLDLMYRLCRSALEFQKRDQRDESDMVWKYARRFYSIGRAEFERRLRSGNVWDKDGDRRCIH